jgi:hypothetical protein
MKRIKKCSDRANKPISNPDIWLALRKTMKIHGQGPLRSAEVITTYFCKIMIEY